MTESIELSTTDISTRKENIETFFAQFADSAELNQLHKQLLHYLENVETALSSDRDAPP